MSQHDEQPNERNDFFDRNPAISATVITLIVLTVWLGALINSGAHH